MWSSWRGLVISCVSVVFLLFWPMSSCMKTTLKSTLSQQLWKKTTYNLGEVQEDKNADSFTKCWCIHFNDKGHRKESACRSVAAFYLQEPTSSPDFGLQNPFSIRARCSNDPELLAVSTLRLTSQDKRKHKRGRRREEVQHEKRFCIFSTWIFFDFWLQKLRFFFFRLFFLSTCFSLLGIKLNDMALFSFFHS